MLLKDMPMRKADYWISAVSAMEQLIGGALATVIGVMLPLLQMTLHPELPSWLQGLIGAAGLIGIGIGSLTIGSLADRQGYLRWFRICPAIIMAGALAIFFFPSVPCMAAGLVVIGIGVGGGYSLDSAYISELLPEKWRLTMVGAAKASCSIGFMGAAVACVAILRACPRAEAWPKMAIVILALGLATLLMRLRWWESPKWLLAKGRDAAAQQAAKRFLGPDVEIAAQPGDAAPAAGKGGKSAFILRDNIKQVIFSGIPWACEGMAVYGFSVFLPVLLMALGLEHASSQGVSRVIGSAEMTAVVNFFMIPGFVIGLVIMRRVNNVKMLYTGFVLSAAGLLLLLAAYTLHWPKLAMLAGFAIYELAINSGPHLVTFIIPSRIYPVADRGEGSGIAALMGKAGAVGGVVLMPILLHAGGVQLVLGVSAAVMLLGAGVGYVYGKKLGMTND